MLLTEPELERWGRVVGAEIEGPAFIALIGDLGAGKSVLARAVARGAGVRGNIPSPTFNLLFRYPSDRGIDVVHLDLYRLDDPDEVWELGWEELVGRGEIVLVEWPERAAPHLPDDRWEIRLGRVPRDPLVRRVEVEKVGAPPELPAFPLKVESGGAV